MADDLPGGRMGMTANGRPDAPWAVIDVPRGFTTIDGWVIFDEDPEAGGGVGYWTVSEVVRNPCGDHQPMEVGTGGPADLVAAFEQQRMTRRTEPVPVSVDGYDGLMIELAVPEHVNFSLCPEYLLWESDPAGSRHMGANGEFDRLWILEVEEEVVVLTVTADASVPAAALAHLTAMVEAAEFVPRSGG